MLKREVAINSFQLGLFAKTAADLSEESMFSPAAGHGHLPIWLLGHLAICAELGNQALGGTLEHPEWLPLFGSGSSGKVPSDGTLCKQDLVSANILGYEKLREVALNAPKDVLDKDHGVSLFADSPIANVGDFVGLLLTNHFGFHLAQLSSCRREAGHSYLF